MKAKIVLTISILLVTLGCKDKGGTNSSKTSTSVLALDGKETPKAANDLPDGTVSFDQPDSIGFGGMHGYCGPVAISNVIAMLADPKKCPTPKDLGGECFKGIIPGTAPTSIADALNKRKIGTWEVKVFTGVKDPIAEIKKLMENGELKSCLKKAPVIALVAYNDTELHYVTIVDLTDTEVVINHNAGVDKKGVRIFQERLTHQKFLDLLGFNNCSDAGKKAYKKIGCGELTVIAQAPKADLKAQPPEKVIK